MRGLTQLNANVWGAAFCDKYSAGMLGGFAAADGTGAKNIMCIHSEVGGASNYDPISETEIAASGMDYIALGTSIRKAALKMRSDLLCVARLPGGARL